ncbi:RNA polymerase sigma factor SigZ [Anaerolineae bacterium CFX7]|nr:RNA polymerase sigma factor SigZ [Anaerolineae bacterium CFX7]
MDNRIETIWNELAANLRRFILKRVRDEQTADDILQNVFIKIHTHLDSLQDDRKLAAWVYQIARNAIADYYRRAPAAYALAETIPASDEMDDETRAALARSLREMVDCLPEGYRTALMLDAFEGLDQSEIGERLGISVSGAKSRVQRARVKLRDLLFDCCHFEFDRRGRVMDYYPRTRCCPACERAPNVTLAP